MFATALAYGMGVSRENIEHGLRTFATSFFQAPGRMNIFDELPFKVIMDYAHNAHGVQAMARLTDQLPVSGQRIVVLAAPGDRRDEDITELARAAAGHYDLYICKSDDHTRGRAREAVPELMTRGLEDGGVKRDQIEIELDEQAAVMRALRAARPGDLVMVFADQIARTWKQIIYFKPDESVAARRADRSTETSSFVADLPELGDVLQNSEIEIRSDERGVYIVPEHSD
jgi:cyanophycin synthetase